MGPTEWGVAAAAGAGAQSVGGPDFSWQGVVALTCAVQHNCRLRDLCHGPKRAPQPAEAVGHFLRFLLYVGPIGCRSASGCGLRAAEMVGLGVHGFVWTGSAATAHC